MTRKRINNPEEIKLEAKIKRAIIEVFQEGSQADLSETSKNKNQERCNYLTSLLILILNLNQLKVKLEKYSQGLESKWKKISTKLMRTSLLKFLLQAK